MELQSSQITRISTSTCFIEQLFKNTTVFKIQHYQRGIAWNSKQVGEIISDIVDAMERNLTEYFIGPITLLQTTHEYTTNRYYDVIDGQQRLTAISLILHHCKVALYEADGEVDPRETQNCKRLAMLVDEVLGPTNDPKLHHKDDDEAQNFRDLMGGRSDKKQKTHLNDMQKQISEVMVGWLITKIRSFTEYFLKKVLCIVICSQDKSLAYQIFETLNARGEKLSEIDLIRNRLFRELPNRQVKEKSDAWGSFRQWFVGHYKGASKQINTRMQDVFSIDLNVREGKWIEPKFLYDSYVAEAERGKFDAAGVIDRVCGVDSFAAYIRSVKPWDAGNEGHIKLCSALEDYVSSWRGERELKVMLPLCYAMFMRGYKNQTIVKNLKVAGALCRRSGVYHRTFPVKSLGEVLSKIAHEVYFDKISEDQSPIFIRDELLKFDLENHSLLIDENFIDVLSRQTRIDDNKAKDIFVAIRNYKAQTAGERLGKSEDLHIEHVLPKEHPDKGWGQFSLDDHSLYKQRLGNLMILSEKLNKQVARRPYSKKRELYEKSRFFDVAYVDDVYDWNQKVIRDRQRVIAEEIAKVWTVD